MVHISLHGLPVLIHDIGVGKLFPYHPRNNHSRVRPTEATHLVSVLCKRSNAGETALAALTVAHVAHPFVEEVTCVGKECSCLGENLGVGRPAQTFVALRTVGRHREIIGALPPDGVGYELVDEVVAGDESAGLKSFCNRRYGNGIYAFDAYGAVGGE